MTLSKEVLYALELLHCWFEDQRCIDVHSLASIISILDNNELDK